jgi:hypothetical protein
MLSANVEDMFNDNNDRGGESKEAGVVWGFEFGEEGRELEDWITRLIDQEHSTPQMDEEDNYHITRFVNRHGLLNNNNMLHGGQQVEKANNVSKKGFQDIGTSPAVLTKATGNEHCHMLEDNIVATNPTSIFQE